MSTKVLPAKEFIHTADYDRHTLFAVVANDVTKQDILRPAFWAHVIPKLRKHTRIELVREDGSLDIELRVVSVGIGYAEMRVLREWEDEAVAAERMAVEDAVEQANNIDVTLPPEYKITHGKGGFVLTFLPSNTRLNPVALRTRAAAVAAARDHATKAGIEWPAATAPAAPQSPEPVE